MRGSFVALAVARCVLGSSDWADVSGIFLFGVPSAGDSAICSPYNQQSASVVSSSMDVHALQVWRRHIIRFERFQDGVFVVGREESSPRAPRVAFTPFSAMMADMQSGTEDPIVSRSAFIC
ncbi:hypothetical protein Vi05172_g11914 [Venturia inaequalis]|nr:hypothetical protein Vi05172_g11914 [Venturia inaequalis]